MASTPLKAGVVNAVEEAFAGAEEHRHHVEDELVDHGGAEGLADRRRSAGNVDTVLARCRPGLSERGLKAVGDEVERGAARHLDRLTPMMGEHEDRSVVRRSSP